MGYVVVILFGLVVLVVLVTSLTRGRKSTVGQSKTEPSGPAADEPTPARSSIAPPAKANAAQERTPPA